jgi:hypothetical protein
VIQFELSVELVLALLALSTPWWAGVALLAAVAPRPPARWWTRAGAFVAGGVTAGAVWFAAAWAMWNAAGWGMTAAGPLDRAAWAANAVAATAAVVLVAARRRARASDTREV